MPSQRPGAFLSYRHVEHEAGADIDAHSQQHRNWVQQFAQDLRSHGVDVFIDHDLRDIFAKRTSKSPWMIGFLGEVSSLCPLICHTFIPILTPSYIERLGYGGYASQTSTDWSFVLEEWRYGIQLVNYGVMQYIPVIRAGDRDRFAGLPIGVHPDNAFDMIQPTHYDEQVRIIAQVMINAWDGDDPLLRIDLPADTEPAGEITLEEIRAMAPAPPPTLAYTEAGQTAASALEMWNPEHNPRIRCEPTSLIFDWTFDWPVNRIVQDDRANELTYLAKRGG